MDANCLLKSTVIPPHCIPVCGYEKGSADIFDIRNQCHCTDLLLFFPQFLPSYVRLLGRAIFRLKNPSFAEF